MRAESRSMLLKSRVQDLVYPGQNFKPLCCLLGRMGEADHVPKHKVTSPPDSRSLAEPSHPNHQEGVRDSGEKIPGVSKRNSGT